MDSTEEENSNYFEVRGDLILPAYFRPDLYKLIKGLEIKHIPK